MGKRRLMMVILVYGMVLSAATPLCHAKEPVTLFEVKTLPTEAPPLYPPAATQSTPQQQAKMKPAKEVSESSWFWRFIEGIVLGAARYNTEKQGDGRPQPMYNPR